MRTAARLFRIITLCCIFCYLVAEAGLAVRAGEEAGWGLGKTMPTADSPAMQPPPLGVTVQILDALDADAQRAALARLAEGGMGWVRVRLDWGAIETQPGVFDWRASDTLLASIATQGLAVIVVLDGSPSWARAAMDTGAFDNPFAPPESPQRMLPFARALAARYGQQVRYYQIWDEPNVAPHWGNHRIDPVGYAQLLRVVAAAIRAEDADAVILAAALAPTIDRGHTAIDEVYFLQRMLAAGAAAALDVVAIQPFGFGAAPENPRQAQTVLNFQRAAHIRRALVAAGQAEMPIWSVRMGWNTRYDSEWATVTPADQLRYIRDARNIDANWQWMPTLGWAIDQPAAPRSDPIWGFALHDAALYAFHAPLQPAALADTQSPGLRLAWLITLIALIVADGVREVARLPLARWRRAYQRAPRWLPWSAWGALLLAYYFATSPVVVLSCWLLGVVLAWLEPRAALLVAAVALPFHFKHKEIALPNRVIAIPPAGALAFALLPALLNALWARRAALTQRARLNLHGARWYDALALAWLLLNLLSAFNVWHWPGYGVGALDLVVVPLLLYGAARLFVQSRAQQRHLLIAMLAGGLSIALIGGTQWLRGEGVAIDGVLRLVGVHFSPNHTALYLVRTLFIGVGLAFAVRGWARKAWLGGAALIGVALALTASRGALLLGVPAGMLTCVALWLMMDARPPREQLRATLRKPAVRAVILLAPWLAVGAIFVGESRLLNMESVDSRLVLWQAALALWRDHAWLGVGPGGFFWNYPAYLPLTESITDAVEHTLLHPHSVWLELATGWGVLGIAWLLLLAGGWIRHAVLRIESLPAAARWHAIGLTAMLAAAFAHAQVDAFIALPDLAAWQMLAMGVWAGVIASEGSNQ